MTELLVRAALAGVGVALPAALLGCFVVWRRMAYFGDATAHAAVLGVALSLLAGVAPAVGVFAVAGAVALLVAALAERGLGADAVLGVLAHGALGLGLFAASFAPGAVDLDAWLFGDVLTVGAREVWLIWAGAALVALLVRRHWALLITATLSPDLARAGGLDPRRASVLLSLLLAGVVAAAAQVVGALLVTALLTVPAAAARSLARTPEAMAAGACAVGAGAALGGLALAVWADAGAGPATVAVATLIFAVLTLAARLRAR